MSYLNEINCNQDVKDIPAENIPVLCEEIRSFLIEKVSRNGGHLASNLGVVELTVALHRVYDPLQDRLLFDVGHQSYVHKMLTGRRDSFDTLRCTDGLAGFPKPCESTADPFVAGHASDSVSVALGMARARTLLKENYDVVAVIGDGAMTGGLAYEALSDAGASGEPIVIVLNDNGMAINTNVGGVAKLLRTARTRPSYLRFKRAYRRVMKHCPGLYDFFHAVKERIKVRILSVGMFEEMGFYCIGPLDGHNEAKLEKALHWARELRQPVVVHVVTKKGKGYKKAELDPVLYHGVEPFDPTVGYHPKETDSFSSVFGEMATQLAEDDPRICTITAAMEGGTGLEAFAERFPDRFFEIAIAEEHAAAMCAGMARQGLIPVFAVYSTFMQRAFDMLIEDVGLMHPHALFMIDRAGIVGQDGATHQGCFDLAYLDIVPGMEVYAPSNYAELRTMMRLAAKEKTGPVAIRYPRGRQGAFTADTASESTVLLRDGSDLTIVCHGILINEVLAAANLLADDGISCAIIKINRIRPLDTDKVIHSVSKTGRILTVEEACRSGSVGSRLLSSLARASVTVQKSKQLDLGSGVVAHGQVSELREKLGLDAAGIEKAAKELLL